MHNFINAQFTIYSMHAAKFTEDEETEAEAAKGAREAGFGVFRLKKLTAFVKEVL